MKNYFRKAIIAMLAGAALVSSTSAHAITKGANLPWLDGAYSNYLGVDPHHTNWGVSYNSSHMDKYLSDMRNMGITVVRLWVNQDDMGCTIDGSGFATGVTSQFWSNMDNAVSLAGNHGVRLYVTLNNGRADFLYNTSMANAYRDRVLVPMINRYRGNGNIYAIDLMNEIDGVVGGSDGNYGSGPSWSQAQAYIRNFASAIHNADGGRQVSCSTGWHKWSNLGYFRGLGLNFYDFHVYDDSGYLPSASSLGMDKPIYVGEAGQSTNSWNDSIQNSAESNFLKNAKNGGYVGVGIWAYQYPGCTDKFTMVYSNGSWRPVCTTIKNFN